MLVCCGRLYNRLATARSITTTGAGANHGAAFLYDGDPGTDFRFDGNDATETITADMALWDGAAGVTGWTDADTGAGASADTTTAGEYGAATPGMKLTTGGTNATDLARRYRDIEVRAGERLNVTASLRGHAGGASTLARVRIQCIETGYYLHSDGTWQTTPTDWATRQADTHATSAKTFTVQAWAITLQSTVTLRVEAYAIGTDGNGSGYVDDYFLWPSTSFVAVVGHSIEPAHTVTWRKSTDNFVGSDVSVEALTLREHVAWGYAAGAAYASGAAAPSDMRYFRLALTGAAQTAAARIGELVVGQYLELGEWVVYPAEISYDWSQITSGSQTVALRSKPRRGLVLPFSERALAYWQELRREVWERCSGALYPIVAVYDTDGTYGDQELCIHGRIAPRQSVRRASVNVREADLVIAEDPFATPVA